MKYRNNSLPEYMKEELKKNKSAFCKKLWAWRLFGALAIVALAIYSAFFPHGTPSTLETFAVPVWLFASILCIFASSHRNGLWHTGCHGNSTLRNCIAKAYVRGVDGQYVLFSFEKAHKYINNNEFYTLNFDGYMEYLSNFSKMRLEKRVGLLDRDMVMVYEPFSPWGDLHVGDEVYMIYRYTTMKKMEKWFYNKDNWMPSYKEIKKHAYVPSDDVIVLKEKKEV